VKADGTTCARDSRNLSGSAGSQVRSGTSTVAMGVRKGGFYEQVIGTAGEFYDPFSALNSVGGIGDVGDALPWFDMKDKLAELAEGHCALLRNAMRCSAGHPRG
jgi:hypothetical protein